MLHWNELSPGRLREWADLESRALEANAYLSPHFIVPAQRHLVKHDPPIILWVERKGVSSHELVGIGIFHVIRTSYLCPLPHLRVFLSRHSYLSGLLVDSTVSTAVMDALFEYSSGKDFPWHGIQIDQWPAESHSEQIMRAVSEDRGVIWQSYGHNSRPVLHPKKAGDPYIAAQFSPNRKKQIRRGWRRLAKAGLASWSLQYSKSHNDSCVDAFLKIEHHGWKKQKGTSLLSNPHDEQFFREMVAGFSSEGRVFFTQISLDRRCVAATCNFISGEAGFAFKTGWDPEFAHCSPGILNEVEIIRRAPFEFPSLKYIDSGAHDQSYMGHLWKDRWILSSNMLFTKSSSRAALSSILSVTSRGLQAINKLKLANARITRLR
jgi:GNAT acetyltransferase-like protein